jgi:hypothetical protein
MSYPVLGYDRRVGVLHCHWSTADTNLASEQELYDSSYVLYTAGGKHRT